MKKIGPMTDLIGLFIVDMFFVSFIIMGFFLCIDKLIFPEQIRIFSGQFTTLSILLWWISKGSLWRWIKIKAGLLN